MEHLPTTLEKSSKLHSVSSFDQSPFISDLAARCQGARDPNRYFVALNVAAAKVKSRLSTLGTGLLDGINAFDLAEVARMNMGQLNMIEVSSFCGPQALFWGHDAARVLDASVPYFLVRQWDGADIPVRDGEPLIQAAAALFGSVEEKRFSLAPGTLCPAAAKSITSSVPSIIYAAVGVGFRHREDESATCLMEDVGTFPLDTKLPLEDRRSVVLHSVADSVMAIAQNQKIRCKEVRVAYVEIKIDEGETGCALLLLPYFSLAQQAVPRGGIERLKEMTLESWIKEAQT